MTHIAFKNFLLCAIGSYCTQRSLNMKRNSHKRDDLITEKEKIIEFSLETADCRRFIQTLVSILKGLILQRLYRGVTIKKVHVAAVIFSLLCESKWVSDRHSNCLFNKNNP